ncbi:ATP-dependent carboxylate-amine ligase [Streptomyces sp. RKND-216]|uniref:ATP-grasp domain-containing protein n=1 Tax=Streptomyces sp. RKND-216 TaxID=2562581 RepID=UPI00109E09AE|nr:ATP-dependent carboxylate-amine ligase [Streptomyces sp. RKND-216]THA24570.1 ATP-dependent carboxylate-amine ligase [Streptomyces sp. RKND-216]
MRHVLVFAKTPHATTPYEQWLAGTGIEPVVLTSREHAAGYGHLRHVHAFDDYDTNQLVEKTALRLARELDVDAVFARAESDVLRAAQLRDLLDLPGQRTASARAFRDKVVMKDHLAGGPVDVPAYRLLDSAYTAVEFVAEHGYPVVVKPVSESGSLGARVLRDEADLDAYLAAPWRGTSQIETFVPGAMYHVDGLVRDGEPVFVRPFRYLNDCLSFRSDHWMGSVPLAPGDPYHARLVDAVRAVLAQLPTPERTTFHAEFWITPDDRTVFCEVASRTGGGMVARAVRHAFGIDLDKEWLYAECGLPASSGGPAPRPAGGLWIPPSSGVLEHLPTEGAPDCVLESAHTGRAGQVFHGGVKSGLFLAGYVVGGESEEDVAANMEKVAAWFTDAVRWRPADSPDAAGPVDAPETAGATP